MAISMLKIRRPLGRLIFNMGIAIPGKTVFLIETAPWSSGGMTDDLSWAKLSHCDIVTQPDKLMRPWELWSLKWDTTGTDRGCENPLSEIPLINHSNMRLSSVVTGLEI